MLVFLSLACDMGAAELACMAQLCSHTYVADGLQAVLAL